MKKKIRILNPIANFLLAALILTVSATSCKEDPDTLPEKVMMYKALCPAGIDACYSECDPTGDPLTDSDMQDYESCASFCDMKCDMSFILLLTD